MEATFPDPLARPLRVLILTWNFPPRQGGIEQVMWHLYHGLKARGHSVRVVTSAGAADSDSSDFLRARRAGLLPFLATAWRAGGRIAREFQPDVVVAGSWLTAPAAWRWAPRRGRAWVVWAYGSDLVVLPWWTRGVIGALLRRAAFVLPISQMTRQLVLELGVRPERCPVIPPGVDVDKFSRLWSRPLPELWPGRRVVLTAGRLVRRKGVLEYVRYVWPEVIRHCPDALLVIVGDDARGSLLHRGEPMRANIESAIRELNLSGHVAMLGAVSDEQLADYYRRAELFVLPCLNLPKDVEGFGIVFLEAALAGTPSLSTRVGGIPDAVVDGVTGVLIEPGDWPELAKETVALLTDTSRRHRMGHAARERAQTEFAWPVIVSRYEAVLRQAAQV